MILLIHPFVFWEFLENNSGDNSKTGGVAALATGQTAFSPQMNHFQRSIQSF